MCYVTDLLGAWTQWYRCSLFKFAAMSYPVFPRTNEGANEAKGLAMGGCCKRAVDSKPQKQPEDDISDLSDYDDGVPSTAVPSISRSRVRWEARGCQRTYSAELDGSDQ